LCTYSCDALGGVVDLDVAAGAASGRHIVVIMRGCGIVVLIAIE